MADHDESLHPYDGRDRRFAHDDADPEQRVRGRALVGPLTIEVGALTQADSSAQAMMVAARRIRMAGSFYYSCDKRCSIWSEVVIAFELIS